MARTDNDTWDLASSVGATATMVALARAVASRADDPLIDDPFAEPLVRAVGIEFFIKVLDGEIALAESDEPTVNPARVVDMMAVRTKFFDEFFIEAMDAGIRQAVILASGLDSRAYRLRWPDGTVVFELDQQAVIDFKTQTLSTLGATPAAEHRPIAIDLRDDWGAALRANEFDDTQPTVWIAEGLLAYLPPDAQDRLFDNITALSAKGSRLATEYHPDGAAPMAERQKAMARRFSEHGLSLDLSELMYHDDKTPATDYLTGHGWHLTTQTREEVFASYGRQMPYDDATAAMRNSVAIKAIRDQ